MFRLHLVVAAAVLVVAAQSAAASGRPRAQQKQAETAPTPTLIRSANEEGFAETERGCAEGRVRDYLERHGDFGVIDADTLLEMTRQVQREREGEKFVRTTSIGGSVWSSIGPTNGAGRATAVALDPTFPGTAIIGAAGGGAWRTTDSGANWTALTDTIPNLSIGAIEIPRSNANVVYLGTGEGGNAIDFIPGIGLLYSSDGGNSWTLPSSVIATQFYKISASPTNANELVVATNAGAMRSTNGQNGPWTTVIRSDSAGPATGYRYVTDLVRDPTNAQVMYAATWDGRYWCASRTCSDPYNFSTPTILKSTDGGQTWSAANGNLPVSTKQQRVNRWAIAIAPSSPQTLYAATSIYDSSTSAEVSHVYKTTDGGTTWSETALAASSNYGIAHYLGTQGWYDNTIVVSPTDPNTVIAGGVTYVKSTDGGATWDRPKFTGSSVHVDAHELRYDAAGTLFIANDGGIWTTPDNGNSATERNANLVTRQYYAIANDPSNRNRVFGGTQDNGTTRRPDSGSTAWDYFTGGDGIGCEVNPLAPDIVYSTYQYAAINRSLDGGSPTPTLGHVTPLYDSSSDPTPFLSRVLLDPNNPAVLYTVTHRLWKSTTGGDSWLPLSITMTDGSTWSTKSYLTAAAIAKSDSNVLMVAQGGTIYRSTNGGQTWWKAAGGLPSKSVNGIEIDPRNPQVAYVALAGMAGTSVYMTQNGGSSWTARGNGLPSFSALVVRVDPTDSSTLYCGTDVGVYRSIDGGASWSRFGTGLPAVSVYDIQILADGSVVRAGTHGRGVWELGVTSPTNSQPVATIATPSTKVRIARGSSLQFSGSVSDADAGDAVTGTWLFPDTWQTAQGGAVQHEFDRAGTFPVTLSAKDSHGAIGTASVNVTVLDPADDCSTPLVIPAAGPFPYTATFDMSGATRQTGDPQSGGSCYPYAIQSTVWLSFTPAVSGTYQFSTCGSSIATVVIGYSGDVCGPRTPTTLCYTNTSPTSDCTTDPDASAVLTAGVPIRILVSGYYSGLTGPVSLTVTQNSTFSPSMASVSPGSGAGGTQVTITGAGFTSSSSVSFGGTPATSVMLVTPSILVATAPSHAGGTVDVAVTNGGGNPVTLGRAFTYAASAPASKRRAVKP